MVVAVPRAVSMVPTATRTIAGSAMPMVVRRGGGANSIAEALTKPSLPGRCTQQ